MWEAFKDFIFWGMSFLYSFVGDWGVAIIIATLFFRVLLLPLVTKQSESTYKMTKMQPRIQEIQEIYADDQQKQQEEMQKIYKDSGFNPISGCLPIFLQMPIFIAVFQVLREMDKRTDSQVYNFLGIIPNLTTSPADALSQGVMYFLPYLITLLIFAFATFIPMLMNQSASDPSQKKTMIIMGVAMSGMMLFIGWSSPCGVLLFWATSSVFAIVQTRVVNARLKHKDELQAAEKAEVEPVRVNVIRKEKKKRPSKKR